MLFKPLALFASLVAATLVSANSEFPPGFTNCGEDTDLLDLQSLKITPWPPKAGQEIIVSASGNLKAPIIDGAEAVVSARVGFVTVLTETIDTCAASAKDGRPCPIAPGKYTMDTRYLVPQDAPKVPFILTVVATNGDGEQLSCFTGPMNLQLTSESTA